MPGPWHDNMWHSDDSSTTSWTWEQTTSGQYLTMPFHQITTSQEWSYMVFEWADIHTKSVQNYEFILKFWQGSKHHLPLVGYLANHCCPRDHESYRKQRQHCSVNNKPDESYSKYHTSFFSFCIGIWYTSHPFERPPPPLFQASSSQHTA